jgi:signal transduction histidine kinase
MSLTNRFSTLLLSVLALILAGFSAALLMSSRVYLDRQVDDRLSTMVTLLKTCVDQKPGWVRWEPRPKRLPPGRWNERDAITWLVCDGRGRVLTRPADFRDDALAQRWARQMSLGALPDRVRDPSGRWWKAVLVRMDRREGAEPGVPRPENTPEKLYLDEVLLAAFVSLDESQATFTTLGWFLAAISVTVWGLTALCARWLSRTTLVPLTRLVQSAQSIDPAKPGWMLAEVGTRDEIDELRRAFNDLLARLHEAYDRQRRFSSEASHQLRTPVAVMIGHLEVAQRYERTPDQYRRVIELAHRRAVALGQLVESLLFLNRAGSGALNATETLDLCGWLPEYLGSRREDPRSSDMTMEMSAPGPLWVEAHPPLLGQLLDNLLDNACKYSRPGTPIRVTLQADGDCALLSVVDRGCGIKKDDLSRVFEPFFRSLHPAGERPSGFGLGLSIVQRIADAFGGSVVARSEPGLGSCFEVRLPLAAAPDAIMAVHADCHPALSGGSSTAAVPETARSS